MRENSLAPLPDRSVSYRTYGRSFCFSENKFFHAYSNLSANKPYHVILESGNRGRYSIAAFEPFAIFKGKDDTLTIRTEKETIRQQGDLLDEMKQWLSPYETKREPSLPDFQGGLIGYISYDYNKQIEHIKSATLDDLQTADIFFLAYQDVFVYDHIDNKLWVITVSNDEKEAERKQNELFSQLKKVCETSQIRADYQFNDINHSCKNPLTFTKESFSHAVKRIQDYIKAGDTFQVNISVRQAQPLYTSPLHIYSKLRELNPSPYMGYIHTPNMQIVNGSPELLIKKRGSEVSTRPIAGTRPRGRTETEDVRYEVEMLASEKERAEHAMLVDLERNDLGKVCEYGTVEADELMIVERYSHVMHIVSNVKGKLADDTDVYDMIKAAFPGGTITGAPKIRTMEIIEELEPVRRGIYTGSIGWIGFNQDTELNIVIRTMIAQDGMAYVQAGAGIVIDSDPEAEYEESLKKARALWEAKEMSEREIAVKVD